MLGSCEQQNNPPGKLLETVLEQLKMPLLSIAQLAELGQASGIQPKDLESMKASANAALSLIECYSFGAQLRDGQIGLSFEPVSASSLMTETAHELEDLAKNYGVELELKIEGKYGPVMTDRRALKTALLALGYGVLDSYVARKNGSLSLAVHRTPRGIVAGMYANYQNLTPEQWRKALELNGRAAQPFKMFSSGTGAGLFVAQTILQAIDTGLHVGRHDNKHGLATTLQTSQQLSILDCGNRV